MDSKFLKNLPKEHFNDYVSDMLNAIEEGGKHSKSSPETLKLFKELGEKVETGFSKIHEKIDGLKEEFIPRRECTLIHKGSKEETTNIINETVKVAMKEADGRYASKLTQKIVLTMCGLILIAFLSTLTLNWPLQFSLNKGVKNVSASESNR